MSERFPGGIISKTAPVPTGPYETGTAPGVWTLDQQAAFVKQGIWPTAGLVPNYIEDVFSTWLYTGNGSTQTITNGIDTAGEGALVWLKARSGTYATGDHFLFDTNRGTYQILQSNNADGQFTYGSDGALATSSGWSITGANTNNSSTNYASWTFRKQAKFFDCVTYTGNGTAGRTVAHNLGSVPGCIIIKRTDAAMNWYVYHRYDPTQYLVLNTTAAAGSFAVVTATSDTTFTLPADGSTNGSGSQYVAYVFAHNAGGFGLTGTDNVISCGSYTGNGSNDGPVVTLGYEPQWVLIKKTTGSAADWLIQDNMRGMNLTSSVNLFPNTSAAESSFSWSTGSVRPLATGFSLGINGSNINENGQTYIYIAIRRGPMKVPTDPTKVYSANRYQYNSGYSGGLTTSTVSGAAGGYGGFPTDLVINTIRNQSGDVNRQFFLDRLRGIPGLWSTQTYAESSPGAPGSDAKWDNMLGVTTSGGPYYVYTPYIFTNYFFKRAPQFFDEVCYTGTGASGQTYSHNLGAVPELMITKERASGSSWAVYSAAVGATTAMYLNGNFAAFSPNSAFWNNTVPTASVFTVGSSATTGASGGSYVAYLFATCDGVSKVGSYTGTGATQTINCGFTGGARWVMIKRTDSTGDWLIWDTVDGMVAGTDNRIAMNTTAAEANNDWVYTASTGFQIVTSDASINASGGTYIYLSIA